MTALLVFVALTLVAGIPVLLGLTPDTRDREWSVGRLIDSAPTSQSTGWQGPAR